MSGKSTVDPIRIVYEFQFGSNERRSYEMEFEPSTMTMIPQEPAPTEEWTRLEFHQCGHCPLDSRSVPFCPIARNLKNVVDHFKTGISHHAAAVTVHTRERTYSKQTELQVGLQSIFGLIMATSGCPHMDFLKLMAKFHLPFSTYEETVVRSLSLYLLNQFLQTYKGQEPDFKLDQLKAYYANVNEVNQGILARLRSLDRGADADQNALVILDNLATLLSMELNTDLSKLAAIVMPHLSTNP